MADVATLVFDIDSAPARSAASDLIKFGKAAVEVSNNLDRSQRSIRDANGQFLSLAESINKNDDLVSALSREFNTAASATLKLQQYQIRLNQAVGEGIATEREAAELLRRKHAELQRGLPLVQKRIAEEKKASDAARKVEAVEKQRAATLDSLRQKYNPLYAASKQYEASLNAINAAHAKNIITDREQIQMLDALNLEYQKTSATIGKSAQISGYAANNIRNLGFQVNDIAMMSLTGQSLLYLIPQQGLQVVQIMGQMKDAGQGLGSSLVAAVRQVANPMALLTLGAVGASAAIIQLGASFFTSEKKAKSLDDKLSSLKSSVSAVRELSSKFDTSQLEDLAEKYGRVDSRVLNLIKNQKIYADMIASTELKSSMAAISEFAGARWYDIGISDWASSILSLRSSLKITALDAETLKVQLTEVGRATTYSEQEAALARLSESLVLLVKRGGEGSEAALELLGNVNTALDQVKQLAGAMPGSNWTSGAVSGVVALQNELRISLDPARRLASFGDQGINMNPDPSGKRYGGRGGDPRQMGGSALDIQVYEADQWLKAWEEAERERKRREKSGAGSGSRELEAAKKQFQSLRELLEQNTLFEFAEYEKRQKQLDNALSKKLLSEKNYQLIRDQLQTYYFGSDYEKQGLKFLMEQEQLDLALAQRKISEERHAQEVSRIRAAQQNATLSGYATFLGNMASAAQAGGDRTTKAVKAFSVAQGILNSYLAYTQVLADPSLIGRPFLRTALAASTLAAGLGAVASMKSGGGASSSTAQSAVREEPQKSILVRFDGDPFFAEMADKLMTEIYEQTGNGRVVVQRDYR